MADFNNVFGNEVITPRGRLVFFDFVTENTQAKHPNNKFPSDRFDVTLIVPKTADLTALKEECEKVAKEAFGKIDGVDMPFGNGDEKTMGCMKGHIVLRAKSKKKPGLSDDNKDRLNSEEDIKAGMWARLIVTPFSYTSGRSKGVTLLLKKARVFLNAKYEPIGGGADFGEEDDELATEESF